MVQIWVSTHSHPKVAGLKYGRTFDLLDSFNTQPPEGGWPAVMIAYRCLDQVSTHSHPKVAGYQNNWISKMNQFQHTATRRWLDTKEWVDNVRQIVSTHSHPKVAGAPYRISRFRSKFQHTATRRWLGLPPQPPPLVLLCFNTQPPEGGWDEATLLRLWCARFNTQPPEGGWKAIR